MMLIGKIMPGNSPNAEPKMVMCASQPYTEISSPNLKQDIIMKNDSQTVTYYLEASAFDWKIAPGKTVKAWGFNKQVPGPTLKAKRGDTLVVYIKNNLPEPTTIHWHGLRVPSLMDGTEEVQRAIMPGETFEYRFALPDAGTYWYHPHTNETVQMERGMYGSIIVEDEEFEPVVDDDRVFMIDDMKLDKKNRFWKPAWFFPRWMERHDGREGKSLLINGKEMPEVEIFAGQTERWRFVNASSARYFLLHLGGKPFRIIGTDGGLIEHPVEATDVLITPGERMDIAVGPFAEGEQFQIESLPYDRGTGEGTQLVFGKVKVGEPRASIASIPQNLRRIEVLTLQNATITKTVKLHGKRSWTRGVDFTINDEMHLHDNPVRVGEMQVWEITNPSMLDHPFHLHGFFFQVLEVNGQAPAYRAWKDTYNVPRGGSIKIAWLPDNRPGKWMYHCHILEHAVAGMMAHFEVVEAGQSVSSSPVKHGH